jgi:hypothetical protein
VILAQRVPFRRESAAMTIDKEKTSKGKPTPPKRKGQADYRLPHVSFVQLRTRISARTE